MNFLAIVLALVAERAFPQGTALGESRLLAALLRAIKKLASWVDSAALPWLLSIAAVTATVCLQMQFTGALAQVLFTSLVLFLCLGPRELGSDVQRLIAARQHGDVVEIERLSRALQSGSAAEVNHRSLIGTLFIQSHERLFGMLLWCMALGPAGAVGYRLVSRLPLLLAQQNFAATTQQSADQLHALAAWLPTRCAAGLFALVGSMDDALRAWKNLGEFHYSGAWRHHSWAVLAEVAAASLAIEDADGSNPATPNLETALAEVLRTQTRALLLLLAGFAVFTSGTLV